MLITKKNFKTENIDKKDIERLLNKLWIIYHFYILKINKINLMEIYINYKTNSVKTHK